MKITEQEKLNEIRRYIKHKTDDTELGECIRHFMSVVDESEFTIASTSELMEELGKSPKEAKEIEEELENLIKDE